MAKTSWEIMHQRRKGKNKGFVIAIIICVAAVMIYNNRESLVQNLPQDNKADAVEKHAATEDVLSKTKPATDADHTDHTQTKEKKKNHTQQKTQHQASRKNHDKDIPFTESSADHAKKEKPGNKPVLEASIDNIVCSIHGENAPRIVVSIIGKVGSDSLQKEMLLKRDDIHVIVKKIMRTKSLSDINPEELRAEMQGKINTILTKGSLSDLEFADLKPYTAH